MNKSYNSRVVYEFWKDYSFDNKNEHKYMSWCNKISNVLIFQVFQHRNLLQKKEEIYHIGAYSMNNQQTNSKQMKIIIIL